MIRSAIKRAIPDSILVHVQAWDHYFFGEPEIRRLHALCSRSRIAIDIGANIGTYTHFMRKHALSVVAYEPHPDLAKRLAKLYPDVSVRPMAVSDRRSIVKLRVPMAHGRPAHELGSVVQSFSGGYVEYDVPSVSLDDEELTDVGFIKIDVEQHELAVLKGAAQTILRWRPNIMTEVTPTLYSDPLPKTFAFLTGLGYIGWFRFEGKCMPFSEFDQAKHACAAKFGSRRFMGNNVIFLPQA